MTNIIKFPAEKAKDNERAIAHTRPYLEHLYAHFALNGCKYQWYDGAHPITKQVQLMGGDVSLICKKTSDLKYIDEKADFHVPKNFCLEIVSNTVVQPQILGWALTSEADRLVYSFIWLEDVLDVFVLDFLQLRRWLLCNNHYKHIGEPYIVPNSPNKTYSRIVPITQVIEHINTYRYLITAQGKLLSVPITGQHTIDIVPRVLSKHNTPFRKIKRVHEGIA